MYILTAKDILDANKGVTDGGGQCGVPPQDQFNLLQQIVRERVLGALEISTFDRLQFQDTFEVSGRYVEERHLRLTNAFLTSDPVVFVDAAGEVVETEAPIVDRFYGVVRCVLPAGVYRVQYKCGFLAEAGTHVYQGLPDWVKSIALATMFLWLRSMNRTIIKDISHASLTVGMIRELTARVHGRYVRPRVGCVWPVISERRTITDPVSEWRQW